MKIVNSDIQMAAQHRASYTEIRSERLHVWVGRGGDQASGPATLPAPSDDAELSSNAAAIQPSRRQGEVSGPDTPLEETKLNALIQLVERLTGKKIKFFDPESMRPHDSVNPTAETAPSGGEQPRRAGFGIEYDYYEARIEEEHTQFAAQGQVHTADGQVIDLALTLNMSRRFMEEHSISLRAGDARLKDPLVLNFNGNAAELRGETFSFDLDADGREDQIALLGHGSGFLALDHNEDGVINDGSELFGVKSGNGFTDLAAYDQDGNRWIDENDAVYDRLRIWTRDSNGNDQLMALGQKNVGAIYLGNVASSFNLTDSDNTLLGQVASSGIFLKEEGGVGTVQQLNLVV